MINKMISDSISKSLGSALQPIQMQLNKIGGEPTEASSSIATELSELKKQQQLLQIETKAATLSSTGAQSQYRAFATIKMKMENAAESLEEFLLTRPSPDDEVYKAISPIRDEIKVAAADAESRIGLIFKADSEPKVGWKAITMFEEKQRQKEKDPEADKVFASCVKQLEDSSKKSSRSSSTRPF